MVKFKIAGTAFEWHRQRIIALTVLAALVIYTIFAVSASDLNSSNQSNLFIINAIPESITKEQVADANDGLDLDYSDHLIELPSAKDFLPHLRNSSLTPAFVMRHQKRDKVPFVLGVPTVNRPEKNYLFDTLFSLVGSMSAEESKDTLIVVYVAETDLDFVRQLARQIQAKFPSQVQSGLIEVISPPTSFYPDLSKLVLTLGDSEERVRWRSKQNLDFAYLMMYCQHRGVFFVHLEDDLLANRNFITPIKEFVQEKIDQRIPWLIIDLCQLGTVGKLYRCADLPLFAHFLIMFYNDKPVDWLLDDILSTKVCSPEHSQEQCRRAKSALRIRYQPSPFKHVGYHSSLRGKVQNLAVC